MSTTYTPATNRYAAIAATVAAGPSEAEQRASREAMLRRRRNLFTLVEPSGPPAPSVFSVSAQQRAVSATTRDDYLADYADAWPTVHDSRDHARLQHRLAEELVGRFLVENVALNKLVASVALELADVGRIAGVRQLVQVNKLVFGVGFEPVADKVGADESSPTGNDELHYASISSTVTLCKYAP
jgi:hypothetical protein